MEPIEKARKYQRTYWGTVSAYGPRFHAILLIVLPLLTLMVGLIVTWVAAFGMYFIFKDAFLYRELMLKIVFILGIAKFLFANSLATVLISLLVGGLVWLAGYLIYILMFPTLYFERVMAYSTANGKRTPIVQGQASAAGRLFWVDDDAFWIYRIVSWGDRLLWRLLGQGYQRPPWEAENTRTFQFVTDSWSVARFIMGFYLPDYTAHFSREWHCEKTSFLSFTAQHGKSTKRYLTRIIETELEPMTGEIDIKPYEIELTKSIEKAETRMDSTVGLNKNVAVGDRETGVVQKKTPWERERDERELTDKERLTLMLEELKRRKGALE